MERAPLHLLRGGWLRFGKSEPQPLGHEVVIRDLLKLDVANDDEVVSFIREHGMLAKRADWLGLTLERPADLLGGEGVAHLVDAKQHLLVARCLARHWLADRLAEDVVPAWHEVWPGVNDEQMAWATFASNLSQGLESFHARVTFTWIFSSRAKAEIARPRADLFSALCHQLFNLYVDGVPPNKCANANCHHVFVHQSGRATSDQYRSKGVIYCSSLCARAQAERERRRRMKGGPT